MSGSRGRSRVILDKDFGLRSNMNQLFKGVGAGLSKLSVFCLEIKVVMVYFKLIRIIQIVGVYKTSQAPLKTQPLYQYTTVYLP